MTMSRGEITASRRGPSEGTLGPHTWPSPRAGPQSSSAIVFRHPLGAGRGPRLDLPGPIATTKSAMLVSSVSPERCDTIAVQPAARASRIVWTVSVTVPIWLSLMRMLLSWLLDAAPQELDVGHEQIVADDLDAAPELLGDAGKPLPIIFGERSSSEMMGYFRPRRPSSRPVRS